jgi:hypothetical protein
MRAEDEEAFDAFVRARGEYFLRVSVLLTGSVPEGEDLLQASLVRLYRAWPRLDVSSSAPGRVPEEGPRQHAPVLVAGALAARVAGGPHSGGGGDR